MFRIVKQNLWNAFLHQTPKESCTLELKMWPTLGMNVSAGTAKPHTNTHLDSWVTKRITAGTHLATKRDPGATPQIRIRNGNIVISNPVNELCSNKFLVSVSRSNNEFTA